MAWRLGTLQEPTRRSALRKPPAVGGSARGEATTPCRRAALEGRGEASADGTQRRQGLRVHPEDHPARHLHREAARQPQVWTPGELGEGGHRPRPDSTLQLPEMLQAPEGEVRVPAARPHDTPELDEGLQDDSRPPRDVAGDHALAQGRHDLPREARGLVL